MAESFQMKIYPKEDVLDLYWGLSRAQSHHVSNGRYKVTLNSNAYYHGSSLPINKVVIYVTTDDQPNGWFWTIQEGKDTYITVSGKGTDSNTIYAFFVDIKASDNTGYSILKFTRV
jgi:hypothetical protein